METLYPWYLRVPVFQAGVVGAAVWFGRGRMPSTPWCQERGMEGARSYGAPSNHSSDLIGFSVTLPPVVCLTVVGFPKPQWET